MKKFGSISYLLLVCALFTTAFTLSCQKKEEPKEEAKVEHAEPSDWDPTDPVLIKGKEIYKAECHSCHEHGHEQSPRLGKIKEWEERLTQSEEVLIKKAIEGFYGDDGEMPARGGADYLTDEEVAAAVKFMIATPKH